MIKGHYLAETAIEESGIPYTILKLTMLTDMIPRYANSGKPFIIGKQNHGWSWIYSGDIAKMASKAFQNEASFNKKLTIFGPEKLSITQAVDKFNKVFFPDVRPSKPKPFWLANLIALFVGETMKYGISVFKYFENHPEEGDPEVANELLGKAETDLKSYFEIYNQSLA